MSLVGADLGAHAEIPEECEPSPGGRRARQVEVDAKLAVTVKVPRPCGMTERRQLGQPATPPGRRDAGELVAQLVRE
jgi:hypothetical protein